MDSVEKREDNVQENMEDKKKQDKIREGLYDANGPARSRLYNIKAEPRRKYPRCSRL